MARRLLVTVALASLGACADGERAVPVEVIEVSGSQIALYVTEGCFDSVRVEAEEGSDEVTVSVFASDPVGGDCGTTATVTLDAPLGDRELVDAESGEVLEIPPAD